MKFFQAHLVLFRSLFIGLLLSAFVAVALYLRISMPYDTVFGGETVRFTGVDAYWHMRMIDSLVHNFPHLNSFDPYMLYPGGGITSSSYPFFDYMVSGVIWVIGLGSPSQQLADTIAALFPAILGALIVVITYCIGKALWNRWAGVIAAGCVAISPGDFLGRSIIGFTDHHIAESFFAALAMLFVILALKSEKTRTQIIYGVLCGVALGCFVNFWRGALIFAAIVAAALGLTFVMDHLKGKPVERLCRIGVAVFGCALVMRLLVSQDRLTTVALLLGITGVLGLYALSRVLAGPKARYFPLAIAGAGALGLGLVWVVAPSLVRQGVEGFQVFSWPTSSISEKQPLLLVGGAWEFAGLIRVYGIGLPLAAAGLLGLLWRDVGARNSGGLPLIIWSFVVLAMTLAQRRFGYYFAVNVSLLAGYSGSKLLQWAGLRDAPARVHQAIQARKKKRHKSEVPRFRLTMLYPSVMGVVLACLVFWPLWGTAKSTAGAARFAPTDAWEESMLWMRENTPEPYGDPGFYYARYGLDGVGAGEGAWGVTSWWDYGYWIVRLAHRMPTVNPGGQPNIIPKVAKLLCAQSEDETVSMAQDLGTKYVVIDDQMAMIAVQPDGSVAGKFGAVASFADRSFNEFCGMFFEVDQSGQAKSRKFYFFPNYYQTLMARMFFFGGEAVNPTSCTVITFKVQEQEGQNYNLVTQTQKLNPSAALAYVASHTDARIVSESPYDSPVALQGLEHYNLVHDAGQVRIFEFTGGGG